MSYRQKYKPCIIHNPPDCEDSVRQELKPRIFRKIPVCEDSVWEKLKSPIVYDSPDCEDSVEGSVSGWSTPLSAGGSYASTRTSISFENDKLQHKGLRYRRVSDLEDGHISNKVTSRGEIVIHEHQKAHYISDEPRASGATYEDYSRSTFRPCPGWGSGRSCSRMGEKVSKATISPEMKYSDSEGSAVRIAAINPIQSQISEGTVSGAIQSQKLTADIQNLCPAEASLTNPGPIGILPILSENAKSNAGTHSTQGSCETATKVKADVHSGPLSELLQSNEESASSEGLPPQTTSESPISVGNHVGEDLIALDTHQIEGVLRDMSCSSSSDYHSSESGENGSDNTSNELYSRLEDDFIDGEQIMAPILDPARQAMVDRVMEEFWVIFSQRWPSNFRQHAGDSHQESGPLGSTISHQHTAQSRPFQRKRQRKDDEEDSDRGSDRSHQPPSQSTPSANEPADRPKFACPFRKHDPSRYSIYSHRACALSHWASIARVKEHLYRCHQMAPHCERCWQTFKNQQELKVHITVDATEICQVKPGHPPDGLTPEIERKLRSRKKTHRNQTDEDRWRDMYRLLFPNEDVPSPYFEPLQDEAPLSPDSRDLANYEEYARRELPRLVRESVLEVFSREMQPVEASLIANLVDTIQECQARLFRSFSERMSDDQQAGIPSSSMADALTSPASPSTLDPSLGLQHPSDEGNSMHTTSNFLNAAFQQPPPNQNAGFEPNFQSHDPMDSLQASNTVDASLSSSSNTMFSGHGYGSERFCDCPSHCNYTSTTISSQSQAADSTCPPGEPDVQDDTFRWQDWNNEPSWAGWFSAD